MLLAQPSRTRALLIALISLLLAAPAGAAPAPSLQQQLDSIASRVPGKLGVAALDLDHGTRAAVRGAAPAPMASVFKLPLAVAVLRRAQEQAIPLIVPIHVRWEDRNPGWSPLAQRVPREGLVLSLAELLQATVSESDNTAADVLLRWLDGPQEVMRILRRLGVEGIRIVRSERALALDLWGLQPLTTPEPLEALLARMERVSRKERLEATRRFSADPRDQASPVALVDLLAALQAGRLLDPEHTTKLLELLRATRTGPNQLRAGFPPDVVLAHKTGQISGVGGTSLVLNDVGIATGNGRRLAIAVLLTDVDAPLDRCQAIIAEVARAVWSELGRPSPAH
jgi:beta-lactamase class A